MWHIFSFRDTDPNWFLCQISMTCDELCSEWRETPKQLLKVSYSYDVYSFLHSLGALTEKPIFWTLSWLQRWRTSLATRHLLISSGIHSIAESHFWGLKLVPLLGKTQCNHQRRNLVAFQEPTNHRSHVKSIGGGEPVQACAARKQCALAKLNMAYARPEICTKTSQKVPGMSRRLAWVPRRSCWW